MIDRMMLSKNVVHGRWPNRTFLIGMRIAFKRIGTPNPRVVAQIHPPRLDSIDSQSLSTNHLIENRPMLTLPTTPDPVTNSPTASPKKSRWANSAFVIAVIFALVSSDDLLAQETVRSSDRAPRSIDALIIELDQFQTDSIADPVDAVAIDGKLVLGVLLEDSPLGVEVVRVTDGLAGDRAGLVKGDKIVKIDEADIETPADAQMALRNHPLGSPLQLVYIRNNRRYEREIRFTAATDADGQVGDATSHRVAGLEREVAVLRRQVVLLRDAIRILAADHHHDAVE
ncbi:MAG: PDZ domain-containing protein [Phycisphaera sp. RhM]|nr:PDZ domain-containing protein [Phycisphaera sp. RhM]